MVEQASKDAAKRMGEVLKVLSMNYVGSIITNGLKPVFMGAINEALEEGKTQSGMEKAPEKKRRPTWR